MKRKFKNQRGESFIETIAAMLIISLAMLMLAGAIVTAARVNDRASSSNVQVVPSTDSGDTLEGNISFSTEPPDPDNPDDTDDTDIIIYTVQPEGGGGNALYYYISR